MSAKTFQSAEIVATKEGRQYHIGLAPGEVAPYILLCGDPARVERVAKYFDDASEPITSREYVTVTGKYQGIPMTVMATGMGPDNTEIAFVELSQIVKNPTLIRIGSSGALRKGIELADLVVSTGAVRLENTSTNYVVEGYPAVAHHECVLALMQAAQNKRFPYHVGLTATAPGFYAAQGRTVPGFAPRDPEIPAKLDAMNVANLEMECSCLFTLGAFRGIRTGAVCAIYANRHANTFIDTDTKNIAEKRCIETGLEAVTILAKMDRMKKKAPYWLPEMGIK
ncbi:MAG: nucleoside phosphorylase [Deltaproteobacteria bacterium]|nr:nucleoside phosphorylase [Deltaproteobacteria bacterium]